MADYIEITDEEIQPGAPYTTGLAAKMRDNHIAMGQRQTGAPWLNGQGAMEVHRTSGSWIVPDGVYFVKVSCQAGGASGRFSNSNSGVAGGNTSFGTDVIAEGGAPGAGTGNGAGGGGTGTLVYDGQDGSNTVGGAAKNGIIRTGETIGFGYGWGGTSGLAGAGSRSGGAGGFACSIVEVTPGETITLTVAAFQDWSSQGTNASGGEIILEY